MKKFKRTFIVIMAFATSTVAFYFVDLASKNGHGPISSTMKEIEHAILGDSVSSQDSLINERFNDESIKSI